MAKSGEEMAGKYKNSEFKEFARSESKLVQAINFHSFIKDFFGENSKQFEKAQNQLEQA